jgi:UPF0042 nucleotide-binding protein
MKPLINQDNKNPFTLILFSFGFKHGTPVDAQLVFDVRFLPNPYWEEGLRQLSGLDEAVAAYVVGSRAGRQFLDLLKPLLGFVVQESRAASKTELRVGLGCTGGRHRSVAIVELLGADLQSTLDQDQQLKVFHRDLDKA